MAKDLNKFMCIGRLGADPDVRNTPQGNTVTTFNVAMGRQWKDADGNQHDETEWASVVAWNKLGEICGEYLRKGARVYIEGRLQTRSWEDQETGQKRYKTEVVANDMIMLDSKAHSDDDRDEQPQRNYQPKQSGGTSRSSSPARHPRRPAAPLDEDEDLPF